MEGFAGSVSPGLLDALLFLLVLELALGAAWLRARGRSDWIRPLALYLVSGGALIAALRLALVDAAAGPLAFALLVSGVAHVGFLAWFRAILRDVGPLPRR